MARPRTPTAILDARGSFLKHPERERDATAILESVSDLESPREDLNPKLKVLWVEIKSYLAPGVLKLSDAPAFESLIRLIYADRNSWLDSSERSQMIQLFSRFGMTPADRSKVVVDAPKQTPLAAFMSRAKNEAAKKPC